MHRFDKSIYDDMVAVSKRQHISFLEIYLFY